MNSKLGKISMVAGFLQREEVIKILKESIEAWENNKTDQGFDHVVVTAMLLTMKRAQEEKGAEELDRLFEESRRAHNLLDKIEGRTN